MEYKMSFYILGLTLCVLFLILLREDGLRIMTQLTHKRRMAQDLLKLQ
jgi:hypothetical protein